MREARWRAAARRETLGAGGWHPRESRWRAGALSGRREGEVAGRWRKRQAARRRDRWEVTRAPGEGRHRGRTAAAWRSWVMSGIVAIGKKKGGDSRGIPCGIWPGGPPGMPKGGGAPRNTQTRVSCPYESAAHVVVEGTYHQGTGTAAGNYRGQADCAGA